MPRSLAIAGLALLLAACSSDKGFGETTEVTADDFGSDWPLTADTAKLTCSEVGTLSITVDGWTFVLDREPFPTDIDANFQLALATDPSSPNGYTDLSPLIEGADELCG